MIMSAGDVRSKIRLYIQVMDRDKEKAIKLGTILRGSIPLTSLKVLEGALPTEEEMSGSSGKRKKKSKSELECEVVAKKKAAGDLILDIRLKPSESMSAAGAMLIELFRVVEGLIDSPLRCRWTAGMFFSLRFFLSNKKKEDVQNSLFSFFVFFHLQLCTNQTSTKYNQLLIQLMHA